MPARGRIAAVAVIGLTVIVAAALTGTSAATPRVVNLVRPVASYPITATFDVDYDVRWSEGEESVDPCAAWETRDGRLTVSAHSVESSTSPFRGFIAVNRPRGLVSYGADARNVRVWAQLTAVGEAEGTVRRTLAYEGGPRSCPGAASYVPPRTDCRRTLSFDATLTRQPATLIAGFRPAVSPLSGLDTLDYSKHVSTRPVVDGADLVNEPFVRFRQSLFVVVRPERELYRSCPATRLAPEYPIYVAFDIQASDWRALAALRPGRRYVLGGRPQVHRADCTDADVGTDECTYRLSIAVTIRRVR